MLFEEAPIKRNGGAARWRVGLQLCGWKYYKIILSDFESVHLAPRHLLRHKDAEATKLCMHKSCIRWALYCVPLPGK